MTSYRLNPTTKSQTSSFAPRSAPRPSQNVSRNQRGSQRSGRCARSTPVAYDWTLAIVAATGGPCLLLLACGPSSAITGDVLMIEVAPDACGLRPEQACKVGQLRYIRFQLTARRVSSSVSSLVYLAPLRVTPRVLGIRGRAVKSRLQKTGLSQLLTTTPVLCLHGAEGIPLRACTNLGSDFE